MHQPTMDLNALLATLADLPRSRPRAFRSLPGIVARESGSHTTVVLADPDAPRIAASNDPAFPEGHPVPPDGVVAACIRTGEPLYLADTRRSERYRPMAGRALPVELALPLLERERVVAVLNLERELPFAPEERRALELFARGVGERLTERSRGLEARLIASLSARVEEAETIGDAAAIALDVIADALRPLGGAIVSESDGRMVPLATRGPISVRERAAVLESGIPFPQGLAWRACQTGEMQIVTDYGSSEHAFGSLRGHLGPVVLVQPIGRKGVHRSALVLELAAGTVVTGGDAAALRSVCRHLYAVFDAIRLRSLQDDLLALQALAVESGTDELYQRILETAVAIVPGAEKGSLVTRVAAGEPFRFRANVGHDPEILGRVELEERNVRAWYGLDDAAWGEGRIRLLGGGDVDLQAASVAAAGSEDPARAGRLEHLQSTLCMPVAYHGEVLAVLNLDSYTRPAAFGRDSEHALRQFAAPVALLLQAAHHRDRVVRISRTDPVTGLPNRRGFDEQLERELRHARRSGEAFAVGVMDMSGFKRVNDTLGHEAGDRVLRRVAEALAGELRARDTLARWAGDEFTVLLPEWRSEDAERVAERFRRVVRGVRVGGLELEIDIGLSVFGEDGRTAAELVRTADRRMYASREARRAVG